SYALSLLRTHNVLSTLMTSLLIVRMGSHSFRSSGLRATPPHSRFIILSLPKTLHYPSLLNLLAAFSRYRGNPVGRRSSFYRRRRPERTANLAWDLPKAWPSSWTSCIPRSSLTPDCQTSGKFPALLSTSRHWRGYDPLLA